MLFDNVYNVLNQRMAGFAFVQKIFVTWREQTHEGVGYFVETSFRVSTTLLLLEEIEYYQKHYQFLLLVLCAIDIFFKAEFVILPLTLNNKYCMLIKCQD